VVFHTILAVKDKKSAAKFHYIKTVNGKSCSAINCLSSGINMLAGGISVLLTSECKGTDPLGSMCVAHTSPHSVTAVRDIEKSLITANMQSKTGFPSSHQLKS